jgi:hypothetical protein
LNTQLIQHLPNEIATYVASPAYSLPDNLRAGANKYGLFEKNEKGVATWIDDASLDPNIKL